MKKAMDFSSMRRNMVERQLKARGISNELVLNAFLTVPREEFVPAELRDEAYDDEPLPIGNGQTISQPYIVALMTELLDVRPGVKVLEIGTGSGYQSAILKHLGCDVYSVERDVELSTRASEVLARLGYSVHLLVGDGTLGWKEHAPYGRIIVTAAAPKIPQPLIDQLEEGGILIIPLGGIYSQDLVRGVKKHGKILETNHGGCRFVLLRGQQGWDEQI